MNRLSAEPYKEGPQGMMIYNLVLTDLLSSKALNQ